MPSDTPSPHARLAELHEKATAGPWYTWRSSMRKLLALVWVGTRISDAEWVCSANAGDEPDGLESRIAQSVTDMELVALLRNHTPYFLALMAESEAAANVINNSHIPDADWMLLHEDWQNARTASRLALESTRTAQGG